MIFTTILHLTAIFIFHVFDHLNIPCLWGVMWQSQMFYIWAAISVLSHLWTHNYSLFWHIYLFPHIYANNFWNYTHVFLNSVFACEVIFDSLHSFIHTYYRHTFASCTHTYTHVCMFICMHNKQINRLDFILSLHSDMTVIMPSSDSIRKMKFGE